MSASAKPVPAFAMGGPGGIGSELTAILLVDAALRLSVKSTAGAASATAFNKYARRPARAAALNAIVAAAPSSAA